MTRRIYVCVSIQENAEETIRFAMACCSFIWNSGLLPMAAHYLVHNEHRNFRQIKDLYDTGDCLDDIRARREQLKLSDEAWFFMNRDADDPMIIDFSMASDLEVPVRKFLKEDLCCLKLI